MQLRSTITGITLLLLAGGAAPAQGWDDEPDTTFNEVSAPTGSNDVP